MWLEGSGSSFFRIGLEDTVQTHPKQAATWAFVALCFAGLSACSDATAPELEGQWGGPEATLTLSALGGSVEYACGAGTIDAGWKLAADGRWTASGQHSAGGGPAPIDGRPSHPAVYAGTLQGSILTFTVEVPELDLKMGPFRVVRGADGVAEMCV